MEIEKQVCSLELAKRLKELGVKQESLFLWATEVRWDRRSPHLRLNQFDAMTGEQFSAFTVAELGEMLPWNFRMPQKTFMPVGEYPSTIKEKCFWSCSMKGTLAKSETEADARAKMLIILLESKLVPIEEINGLA